MTQKVILVTGGAGFIGSHTVGHLLKEGFCVAVIDNFRTGKRENLEPYHAYNERLHIFEVDIVEGLWPVCEQIVRTLGPIERIIHLAAQTSVISSIVNPVEDVRINYTTTIQLLEYARLHGIEKMVMASSASVYGDVDVPLVSEELPTQPLSPYGIHKRCSELQMAYYHKVHGVPTTALRFFNAFGPRLDDSSAYASVIPIFFRRALHNQSLGIYGDGAQTRDFVFVEDLAAALVTASLSAEGAGEAINIGTGNPTTIQELAELIIALTGSTSSVEHLPRRPGEIVHSCCDIALAQKRFDFQATTTLQEGLSKTFAWHQSRLS